MALRSIWVSVLCSGIAVGFAAACSSDNSSSGSTDGGTGGTTSTGGKATGGTTTGTGGKATGGTTTGTGGKPGTGGTTTDGGDAGPAVTSYCGGKTGADQIACGAYIVTSLDACGDCHTPRLPSGAPDTTKILAGNPSFADLDPASPTIGNIPTPNLTQLGKKGWTAKDITTAILTGVDKAGLGLFPIMPYQLFHNMAQVDADAIAAYILSLTPIDPDTPVRQPLPSPISQLPLPVAVLDGAKVPDPVFTATDSADVKTSAEFGKYLAGQLGPCIDCHSPRLQNQQVDSSNLFAGGETFVIGDPFGTVTSLNITQSTNGIKGWTADDVAQVIQKGIDKDKTPLCPPMPFGPRGAFAGLKTADVHDIAEYITHLPAVESPSDGATWPMCVPPPPPPPPDAGKDASSSDASKD